MRPSTQTLECRLSKLVSCRYLLFLPGHDERFEHPAPLMLFLHGAGERGDDLAMVATHGPPRLARQGGDFPFILAAPQCPTGSWWNHDVLNALLDDVITRWPVDTARLYLTGISMGGFGTWGLAIDRPERFAALAPVCGGGYPYLAYRLRHVPIWAFHGAKDDTVPLYESERMVEAVRAAGGQARLTVYPDAGHDAWTETYNNPAVYDWLLSHRRSSGGE